MSAAASWRRLGAMAQIGLGAILRAPSRLTRAAAAGVLLWMLAPLWRAWPSPALAPLAHRIDQGLPMVAACGGAYAVLRAATAVPAQVGQRLVGVLFARPLRAWEYFAGQAAAYVGIYLAGVGALWLVGALVAAMAGTGRPGTGALLQAWAYVPAVVASLPLAAVSSPLPAVAVLLLLGPQAAAGLARWAADRHGLGAAVARWLAALGPVEPPQQGGWLWLWASADNLAYALLVLAACAWWFERADLPLRAP